MSQTYDPIYSNFARCKQRVKQLSTNTTEQVLIYQMYIDGKVNNTLRASLGTYDKNGFYILLPLDGTYDVIDISQLAYQLAMDLEIQQGADDCVIAKFRQDTAENDQKVRIAEESLLETVRQKYGGSTSVENDLTTPYLAAQKIQTFNNGYIQSFSGSGVLLAYNSPPPNGNIPENNPDNRVIFLPGPQFF